MTNDKESWKLRSLITAEKDRTSTETVIRTHMGFLYQLWH